MARPPEPVALASVCLGLESGQSPQDAAGWDPPTLLPLNPAGEEWSGLLSQDRTWGRRSCSWRRDPSCRGSPGTPAQPRPSDLRGQGSRVGRAAPAHRPQPQGADPSVDCAPAQRGPVLLGAEWVRAQHVAGATPGGAQRPRPSLVWSGTRGRGRGCRRPAPRPNLCWFPLWAGRTGKGCGPGWVRIPGAEPGGGRRGQAVVWAQARCSHEPPWGQRGV